MYISTLVYTLVLHTIHKVVSAQEKNKDAGTEVTRCGLHMTGRVCRSFREDGQGRPHWDTI